MSAGGDVSAARVSRICSAAIKGTRLRELDEVQIEPGGAVGDRRFFVIDARERMVNGKHLGALQSVVAVFDASDRRLALTFPEGERVEAVLGEGAPLRARFFSREREGRLVDGPFGEALSAHVGQPVRLVETDCAVDRGARGAVSLVSTASLRRLAAEAGSEDVDARRFRMLLEVDGPAAHEEDTWVGRRARVGDALVRFEGHVGRCLVTSRDPDTGEVTLPTLDLLGAYRREAHTTEPLPFGVHGRVLEPGLVRVGDQVTLARGR